MAWRSILILWTLAFAKVNATDLNDFTNDLATNVGPLLALFGESMTKQYLSESTSFLDYFIFAMAPIGILTIMVSTIRLCGRPSLRAFIGRSQEGDGAVEAELCTSTSRDVCELFNRGSITRVLGRPNILELVYDPRYPNSEKELSISRHYFQNASEPETDGWREVKASGNDNSFAPNPNLSLNIGIKHQPRWVFFLIAILGFILQAGIIALAGTGVWIFGWNLNSGNSASRDYAPIMFITGTVLMCGGTWFCAYLIGETTRERYFQRNDCDPAMRPRLLWLQPGPQVIGDQSFDPFAYFENMHDPIQLWMSSQRIVSNKLYEKQ
ncbi:hypothetical protein PT974_06953 [Cladobotryum mycophilum]|uniref:Uncharacterized protein n=1 Tax=Cladobotryum mycophilum TaxID=491253 RepID=A0ABR0SMV9_9HYPO